MSAQGLTGTLLLLTAEGRFEGLRAYLQGRGLDVVCATDLRGQDFGVNSPVAVLVDADTPGYSVLIGRLAQLSPGLPFLILASAWDPARAEDALRQGAFYFLPMDPEGRYLGVLTAVLERCVERLGAREERSAIRRRMRLFSRVIEQSHNMVMITNREGHIEYVNPAFTKVTGYTPEDALGKNPSFQSSGAHDPAFYRQFWETLKAGRVWQGEFCNLRKDGGRYWDFSTISPIYDEDGRLTNYLAVREDITLRKHQERALRESEENFRQAFESAGHGMALVSPRHLRFLRVNQALCRTLGMARTEFFRSGLMDLTHPEDRERERAELDRLIWGGADSFTIEMRFVTPTGRLVWALSSVAMLRDNEGGLRHLVVQVQDVTRQKEAEAQLKEAKDAAESANRAKSAFLANMSHEIRTPMNAILGFSEVLYREVEDPRLRRHLETIRSSGRSLMTLINDILDLSKIESGVLDLEPAEGDLETLIHEVVGIFSLKAEEKGLLLEGRLAPGAPRALLFDALRLRQVLVNLVGNAIKFTERGEVRVEVSCPARDEQVRTADILIRVTDTGKGIQPEMRDAIFEAFRQQDGEDTRIHGGTGLGLAISRRLVEMMHGRIGVESEPGRGACFEVRLPGLGLGDAPLQDADDTPPPSPPELHFAGGLILVVDDVAENRDLVRALLRPVAGERGVELLEAADGEEALARLAETRPHLVLLDLCMPVLDGYQALARIRADAALADLPVYALNASVIDQPEAFFTARGFTGLLPKPLEWERLIAVLARHLPRIDTPATAIAAIPPTTALPSAEACARFQASLGVLEGTLLEQWRAIRRRRAIGEIERFGEAVSAVGEHTGIAALAAFGGSLLEQARAFDVIGIATTLERYPVIIANLKQVCAGRGIPDAGDDPPNQPP